MSMKHTPGPWGIVEDVQAPVMDRIDCISHAGGPICGVFLNWLPEGMNRANARLIAAAPELLEALRDLAYRDFGSSGWDSHMDAIALRARSAIAKATGESA